MPGTVEGGGSRFTTSHNSALLPHYAQLPHHFLVMGNYQVALPKISAAEAEQVVAQQLPQTAPLSSEFKRSKEKPLLSCSMYYFGAKLSQ